MSLRRTVRGAKECIFQFFGDPDRAYEEVDEALKECGFVSFYAMAGEKEDPAAEEERDADAPPGKAQQDDTRDDDGDSDCVHHLVPGIGVLVIILRHVLAQ